ncbi:MAG TPA: nuclear transport factor 2 family protein [Candidatus Polarisedimenticolia bacterium]|nr:nuclear transport factor 2 family protein [Candidatus Polarisedimenticolia bacterium]
MSIHLPPAVRTYIDSVNADRTDAQAAGFSNTATVQDEGRTYEGASAISGWMAETKQKYSYTIKPTNVAKREGMTIITATLTGDFPGSPIQLQFDFELKGDSITSLKIHP